MFNPTAIVIDAYVRRLQDTYARVFGSMESEYTGIIGFVGRMALENIANTDAAYHDLEHTIMVAEVGQEILKGKHMSEGGVAPRDWLHFVISLLCHDIGYVRGILRGDRPGVYVCDLDGNTVEVPPGATDAALTPYHVARSKLYVQERFGRVPMVDPQVVSEYIEFTRFPVPENNSYRVTDDYPALLRSADLIGQMADIGYLRKCAGLYREFEETGAAEMLGYSGPQDLRDSYPRFFWSKVKPYIGDGLRYLRITQEGKQWEHNLYANIFIQEHAHDLE